MTRVPLIAVSTFDRAQRTSSTSNTTSVGSSPKATEKPRGSPKPFSFREKLDAEIRKKGIKLPIAIAATKSEVDEFLESHEEELHLRWRFWRGDFIVEELNSDQHENTIGECMRQLGAATKYNQRISMSYQPTLRAPASYENESGTMKPDGCIRKISRKVKPNQKPNAANDKGNFYPSIVVEVGFSQRKQSLRNKVDAWLEAGNDYTGVRCVIEINIDDGTSPPSFMEYRIHRRGQTRRPRVTKITLQDYLQNEDESAYQQSISAEDACYPDDPPNGVGGLAIDFGLVFSTLPGVITSEEDEDSDDEHEEDKEKEHSDHEDEVEPSGKSDLGTSGTRSFLGKRSRA